MAELSSGAIVRVVNPSAVVQVSMPGLVRGVWLKEGPTGPPGRNVTSVARTAGTGAPGTLDTYTITFSDGDTTTFQIYNGTNGTNGTNGSPGTAGRGIVSIARTSGTGAAGTTDTYTITYTDATTSTFQVVNGANGTGSGDVVGPASATVDNLATFNATTGKLLKDSGVAIGTVTGAAQKSANLSDLTSAPTARANIGAASSAGGGREGYANMSGTAGTITGDLSIASVFGVAPSNNITLAFSNVPIGVACTVTVIVTQPSFLCTVTPPAGTKWMGAPAPTQVANKACAFTFLTTNGGTTWYASAAVEQ